VSSAARGADSTLAIVKPSAVTSGAAGALLEALQAQFAVTAAALVTVDRARAADFLEVYKGVVPEYGRMVEELTAGPALVLEICAQQQGGSGGGGGESIVQQLREAAGPADPELARLLRPHSLRARFGAALHVTDLESDGRSEVAFFFHTA
jgi:nucleoside-diphosphate kinase